MKSRRHESLWTSVFFAVGLLCGAPVAQADHLQQQLDNSGASRLIPDLVNGGTVALAADQIIDVLVLGDGYKAGEDATFFADAQDWYDDMIGTSGIRPFTLFREAFRVQAIFNVSTDRASSARDSYYRVPITGCPASCSVTSSGLNGAAADDVAFRSALFASIDAANTVVNLAQYPDDLSVAVTGGDIITPLAGMYSNLVIVMLVRMDSGGAAANVSGVTATVTSGTRIVRIGFGTNELHEFGHAFAYLKDEYIEPRGSNASLSNPAAADRSVFKLSNLTYSNDRCDLLWPHLAPGGQYNPNLFSPIGNLFIGGVQENGVWHCEYQCLMNGTHDNYQCNQSEPPPGVSLRDGSNLCFWCEEIVAVRILEKTGQFARAGDPADVNDRGETWFTLWDSTLRDLYYNRFDLVNRIAAKNACYGFGACPPTYTCTGNCDTTGQPACLYNCGIHERGNAIYVDSASGAAANPGTKSDPLDTILGGVAEANALCASPRLVAIKPGSYPGPLTISDPATLIAQACSTVSIGN